MNRFAERRQKTRQAILAAAASARLRLLTPPRVFRGLLEALIVGGPRRG